MTHHLWGRWGEWRLWRGLDWPLWCCSFPCPAGWFWSGLIESHSISQRWRSPAASLWWAAGEWAAEFVVNSCSWSSSWYHGNRSVTYVGGNVEVYNYGKTWFENKPSREWLIKVKMEVIRKMQGDKWFINQRMKQWKHENVRNEVIHKDRDVPFLCAGVRNLWICEWAEELSAWT